MSDIPAEGLRFIASAVRRGANPPGVPALLDEAAAELTRLRADLAQLEQESDAEIALLRDYLASAERHRAEEMEERHRLVLEVIRLRADLAAAQEREQRMRGALALIAVVDQGCGGNLSFKEMAESAMRQARAALSAMRGEP